MNTSVIVKSILAADPYYQCITHMMPRAEVATDSTEVSASTSS